MHARTFIRRSVVSLLKNSSTLKKIIGDKIYESKIYPIDNAPAILVYTSQEQVLEHSMGYPRSQTRQLTLIIEAYAKANTNIDTTVDSLALGIEETLSANHTLGGMIKDITLLSSETIFSGDGDKPIAVATLTYHLTYRIKENKPNKLI